jgi:hypothetical protein
MPNGSLQGNAAQGVAHDVGSFDLEVLDQSCDVVCR